MAIPGVSEQIARKINCRGKRQTAAFIHNLCFLNADADLRDEIFDMILNPNIPIEDFEVTDWSQWLLAGGKTPEEYAQAVSKYDNATACGLVWTANFVAYRCRTCGISPCMSLCSDCFQRGNHKGHDFNMFRSQAGGACDCGDKSVMKESGFCERHGSQNSPSKTEMPEELLCVPRVLMPRLFLRLIQHLREYSQEIMSNTNRRALMLMDCFVLLLRKHSELAAQLRSVITEALTDPEVYYQLAVYYDVGKFGAPHIYKMKNLSKYLIAKNLFELNFDDDESLLPTTDISHDSLKNSSFLDELVFWTIKFEFPQNLVCLLLNMMPDFNYKVAFTKIFVKNYDSISKMIASAVQTGSEAVSNRVVHVSVQLFSNEELAYCMTKHHDLLKIMINSIHSMMIQITQKNTLQCADKNYHIVVNCSHSLMKDHSYWAVASDLNNVLAHEAVAFEFLSDSNLLQMFFKFLSLFQGMDVNHRELKDHVEFESNTYYAAFAAELEASATPMWALISHLKSPEALDKTKKVLEICVEAISQWFEAIGFHHGDEINPFQISFHIPLHRYYACFLGQAIRYQNATLDSLLPTQSILEMMMMHPLQAQVVFHEILSNMWVRCGIQIKGQAMTYIQCHFCNSFVDADLLLLQVCAMKLNPDWFLKTIMRRFHVWEWLTFHPNRSNSFLEQDKVLPMVEGALSFLAMLLAVHVNLGMTEQEVTRQEMLTLLCMADRTHSQLLDTLPEKIGETSPNKDFEKILSLIADYKSPNFEVSGTMVQGTFVLKGKVWEEEYDPIHVLLRAVHRREYQSSLDRYTQYLRQSNKYSGSRPPWPPYRIPGPVHKEFIDPRKILHSKTMHGIIFTILYRAVNDPDLPEQILSLCIYLLDMAVQFPYSKDLEEEISSAEGKENMGEVEDMDFGNWFDSSETMENVSKEICRILVTEKVSMSMRMVEEMEVDEEIEDNMDMGLELYEIQSPGEDPMVQAVQEFAAMTDEIMALPASSSTSGDNHLVPVPQAGEMVPVQVYPSSSVSTSSSSGGSGSTSHPIDIPDSTSYNMAVIPTSGGLTTLKPHHMRLKRVPGRHRLLLSDKGLPLDKGLQGLPLAIECCNSDDSSTSGDHKYMSFSSKRTVVVNKSILSLLLQLHSKMSEKPDSYQVKSRKSCSNSRIGDGVFFIESVLDHIASNEENAYTIQKIRNILWPKREESNASPSMDSIDKEERRRRAKERQQKLMAEFASKQKAFMQKTKEAEFSEGASSVDGAVLEEEKEYECVICGQMSASEENRPVGMVVLLQATSVVGHCHQMADRRLPCSDEERIQLDQGKSLAAMEECRVERLGSQFDNRHWPMSVNIGWQGGVHVQSCGHYLHIDCHKSYIQSLKSQNQLSSRLQNLAVDRGEYSCPLCRQLANSVIPLSPAYLKNSALVKSQSRQFDLVASELNELMSSVLSDRESKLLKKYMGAIMEDITNATFPQYRSLCSPNSSSLFLFVNSISRTNLEIELVQQGRTLLKPFKKKPCFVPLMHVLSLHSRLLMTTVVYSTNNFWPRLTGQIQCDHYSLALWDFEVPLLLRDPIALLLQIVLTLPLNIEKAYFSCIVQVLYNFLYIQGLLQLTCAMKSNLRSLWLEKGDNVLKNHCDDQYNRMPSVLMTYVIQNLQNCSFYLDDDENMEEAPSSEESTDEFLVTYCLHFLRIASLLQCHLYQEDIPSPKENETEFELLSNFLGLEQALGPHASSCRLKWVVSDAKRLVDTWCEDFCNFANKAVVHARALIIRHIKWMPPALLKLPYNYDDVFKYYYKRQCPVCQTEPRDPSLCLVCGTMVCLREYCCRQSTHSEAVLHSVTCGAGTAMYLAVNSSTIIVIRGKRACLWGSVYLDSYGEEDRDLKRGKPLYLCEERYKLLELQWINHSFDHTNKRWVWHKDNL